MKKIISFLSQIFRGIQGIYDTFTDNPKIGKLPINIVGETVKGEYILCYKIGNGDKKILYIGGIHGNEIGTVKLMTRWGNFLYNHKNIIHPNITVFIVPCLNIDGYNIALKNKNFFSRGKIGKTNHNQVDLNRNFPTNNWKNESILFAGGKYSPVSGGEHRASEPEIKSFINLIKTENIQDIYLYHNCWGTVFGKGSELVNKKVQEYSKLSGYRIFLDDEWNNFPEEQKTGNSMIYAEENKIDMIEVELKTRWGSEWDKNKKALINSLKI